jgi:outer membrane protein OmpA-like peptidoglycan-associated protein
MPAAGRNAAEIVFVAGSSQLLQPAADEVKAFATKRGNAIISVTGYGEANGGDPAAQSAAVTLGLARAQAVVAALKSDGVPANAIRVNAEASGRGAALRLLQ